MASYFLPKLSRYIPLWQRRIPKYPLYQEGNPQLRIFLPLFWMKMVKMKTKLPPDTVAFEIHPQMTKLDVAQYIEKIYQVPVQAVRSSRIRGEQLTHPEKGYKLERGEDRKFAFVQLADGKTFEFPELFQDKKTSEEKTADEYRKMTKELRREEEKKWDRMDVPQWFR